MTLNDALEPQTLKPAQLVQRATLLLAVAGGGLLVAFRQHDRILLAMALAFCTVVIPAGCVVAKRLREKRQQRQTEERLMEHTRTFLSAQEPRSWPEIAPKPKEPDPEALGERLLATLKRDGSALPRQDFRTTCQIKPRAQPADAAVFDAILGRKYLEGAQPKLPAAVIIPFDSMPAR